MLDKQVRKTSTTISTRSTVLDILPGDEKNLHRVKVATPRGLVVYESRFVLLTTGFYESSGEKSSLWEPGLPASLPRERSRKW